MSQAEMTFWDHLEELRKTLFRAIGILLVAFIVCFALVPKIFDVFILGPSRPDFSFISGSHPSPREGFSPAMSLPTSSR